MHQVRILVLHASAVSNQILSIPITICAACGLESGATYIRRQFLFCTTHARRAQPTRQPEKIPKPQIRQSNSNLKQYKIRTEEPVSKTSEFKARLLSNTARGLFSTRIGYQHNSYSYLGFCAHIQHRGNPVY